MIAEVYPCLRLPRRMRVFDYQVPESMVTRRGQVVQIPFRGKTVFGVVRRLKDVPFRGIQTKELSVVCAEMQLSETEITFLESAAEDVFVCVPTFLHVGLPLSTKPAPSKKRELPISRGFVDVQERHQKIIFSLKNRRSVFVQIQDLSDVAACLQCYLPSASGSVHVLCPTVRDARILFSALREHGPVLVTGKESIQERHAGWMRLRTGVSKLLIGTRAAHGLTTSDIDSLWLVRSSAVHHKLSDRNPRTDTRELCRLLSKLSHARLCYFDVLPRADELSWIEPGDRFWLPDPRPKITLVRTRTERPASPHPLLMPTTLSHIEQTLAQRKRVLLICNNKGEDLYENRSVVSALQKWFPSFLTDLVEKGHASGTTKQAQIIVATSYYLERYAHPFRKESFGMVGVLNADAGFFSGTYRSLEHTLIDIERWRMFAQASGALFLLQTDEPERWQSYQEHPEAMLEEDLAQRIRYGQPPALRWASIRYQTDEPRENELLLDALTRQLRATDPSLRIGKRENKLFVGYGAEQAEKLKDFLKNLPDQYSIDPYT